MNDQIAKQLLAFFPRHEVVIRYTDEGKEISVNERPFAGLNTPYMTFNFKTGELFIRQTTTIDKLHDLLNLLENIKIVEDNGNENERAN